MGAKSTENGLFLASVTMPSGVFAIRGEGNFADMINVDQNSPSKKFTRLNFGYKGGLRVRSVPVGSVWQIVLSDQPVVRRKAA